LNVVDIEWLSFDYHVENDLFSGQAHDPIGLRLSGDRLRKTRDQFRFAVVERLKRHNQIDRALGTNIEGDECTATNKRR